MLTITIKPQGFMANQMVEYMFAKTVQSLTQRESRIIKYDHVRFNHPDPGWKEDLHNWGINPPETDFPMGETFWLRGNDIDFKKLMRQINENKIDNLIICGPLMNIRYFYGPEYYRSFFQCPEKDETQIYECAEDEVLIHIRGGDIMEGAHRDYFPLPLNYYTDLIKKTGLKPVFMGQIGSDVYSTALKKQFEGARFLERKSVVADFETIRRAKNVITSISSFAWLATWLSTSAKNIYSPVAGFQNPSQRNDIDLIERNDPRYHYYKFDEWKFNAKEHDFDYIISGKLGFWESSLKDIPYFVNRLHRGIHNKFKVLLPLPYSRKRHQPLGLIPASKAIKRPD